MTIGNFIFWSTIQLILEYNYNSNIFKLYSPCYSFTHFHKLPHQYSTMSLYSFSIFIYHPSNNNNFDHGTTAIRTLPLQTMQNQIVSESQTRRRMHLFLHRTSNLATPDRRQLTQTQLPQVLLQNRRSHLVRKEMLLFGMDHPCHSGSSTKSRPYSAPQN